MKWLNIFLGIIAFVADFVTIIGFLYNIFGKKIENLWTFSGIFSLILVVCLFFIGIFLIKDVSKKFADVGSYIGGFFYIFASYIIYIAWVWNFLYKEQLEFSGFLAFFIIFISFSGTGIYAILITNSKLLKIISYGYAFVTVLTVVGFIYKYVFKSYPFTVSFIGEIFLFLIGSFLYILLYKWSED